MSSPQPRNRLIFISSSTTAPPLPKRRLLVLDRDLLPRLLLKLPPQLVRNLLVLRLLERRLVALVPLAHAILLDRIHAYPRINQPHPYSIYNFPLRTSIAPGDEKIDGIQHGK